MKNKILIWAGMLCISTAIWLLASFPWALLFLGIFITLYGAATIVADS